MRIGLFILIFSLNPIICFTQIDSTYIKQLKQKISIINYTSKRFLIITENIDTKEDLNISYKPNNPATIGLGLSINNSVVSFSYGYGIDFMRDKKKEKQNRLIFSIIIIVENMQLMYLYRNTKVFLKMMIKQKFLLSALISMLNYTVFRDNIYLTIKNIHIKQLSIKANSN